ncbi:hypothetical protein, partial [Streptococcus infantarius]|uniref:hypothetical protein n=1 Tax=Streptococcus infantarius TaxID=102684 RepID=UPI0022E8E9C5
MDSARSSISRLVKNLSTGLNSLSYFQAHEKTVHWTYSLFCFQAHEKGSIISVVGNSTVEL